MKGNLTVNNTNTNNATTAYFATIAGFPILSEDETKRLVKLAQSGDKDAAEQVINCHLKLAVKIASSYVRPGFDLMEAVSYANEGLIDSVMKWNPDTSTKFVSYASRCMASKLRDGTRSERLQPISDYAWRELSQVKKARAEYYQMYECEPSEWDLADMLGGKFTPEKVRDLLDWSYNPDSFDCELGDEDSLSLEDVTGVEDDYALDF
ncbi:MAG: hypothetical protein MJ238_04755 [Bacilli bacterium]|nr:hypothetical protein [Bacilli bacterium]